MSKYDDFISGERFQELADWVVGPGTSVVSGKGRELGRFPIIYAHTHNAMQAMQYAHKRGDKCVVITHNSDGRVKAGKIIGENDISVTDCPQNVVRWYAQNVDVAYNIPDYIAPIPIGLENKYCFPYDKARMLFDRPQRLSPELNFYLNFNVHTNPSERLACLQEFQYASKDHWEGITIDMHQNGDDYHHYLNQITQHKIIVSPEGNGLDCHRTWEALYMNRCVLLKSNPTTRFFAKFEPRILLIDDWSNIQKEYERILSQYIDTRTITLEAQKPDITSLDWWKRNIYNGT